jgi:hypothetical protein
MADSTTYGGVMVQGLTLEKLLRHVADTTDGHDHDGTNSKTVTVATVAASGVTAGTFGTGAFTFPDSVTVGDNADEAHTVTINANAGQYRQILLKSAQSTRWLIAANNAAEGGSEAGSNFQISRYNDAGSYVDSPFVITRSTGVMTLGKDTNPGGDSTLKFGKTGAVWLEVWTDSIKSDNAVTINAVGTLDLSIGGTTVAQIAADKLIMTDGDSIEVDIINEATGDAGVIVEGTQFLDNNINPSADSADLIGTTGAVWSAVWTDQVKSDGTITIYPAGGSARVNGILDIDALAAGRLVLPVGADQYASGPQNGSIWVEGEELHYIDSTGTERTLSAT